MKNPIVDNQINERLEQLESRCNQLETALATITNNMVTFDNLAVRLVGTQELCTKKERKPRTKRVLTPEEKAAFHARMVAGRLAKQKASKN